VKKPCSATDPLWYKDAVIYELHVRAFADSNADGIGDFQGLISRLDYLQELGVTCLWLLPFFPSPLRDDGYDIADYTSVNPSYGTLDDFRQFLTEAHARNMQVMIEMVINHTSDQHPWFRRARLAPKGSPERDMYVWSDTDRLFEDVRIIFTDTEKSNWTWDEAAQQYYWHRFFSHQPDLNFDNPIVMEEILKAIRFWLDMGVDAMRLDAIPYLVERDGTSCENVPETHEKIKHIRAVIDAEYENRLILAEANMWPADVRPYFGDGDECHMAFHFPLMPRIYMALRQEDRLPITDIMAQTPDIPLTCQWGLFLRNHDELTLEMVTNDERDYMYLAYSADPRMRINVGIRRRLAPLVDNNRRRIELLNSLLLSFPGTPILYYGDEIGMGDNIYLGDRNGVRTPMQWNSDRNAGFSKAVPAKLYFPVIMDPIWGYQAINVEAQQSDPSSLLHWMRNMINLRKLFQVFGRGTLEFLHPENRKVLAYTRSYQAADGHSETVLCVANLSRFAQPAALDLSKFAGMQPVEMLGYVPFPVIDETLYTLTLAPYSFFWLELQTAAPKSAPAPEYTTASASSPRAFVPDAALLERVLPAYIAGQRWFGGKSRGIRSIRLVSCAPLPQTAAALCLVEVTHNDGGVSLYQLPLAIASNSEAETIKAHSSHAVIITLDDGSILYDATASDDFRTVLLRTVLQTSEQADSQLEASYSATDLSALTSQPSRVGSAEQSNTSILYGDQAILKLYRHVQCGENPDVEVARFLTDVAQFHSTPAYLGDLHLASDGTTLAFLQAFAANEGDGWQWTLTHLERFYTAVANLPAPRALTSQPNLNAPGIPQTDLNEFTGPYLEAAELLGKRTAEMHLALATPVDDSAFSVESFTANNIEALGNSILTQAAEAFDALQAALSNLPTESRVLAAQLSDKRQQLLSVIYRPAGDSTTFGARLRIHGDYHLGQLLRTTNDFLIVDFEGEPARPLSDRRRKNSPLKDVAGMLRSFGYAAHAALPPSPSSSQLAWSSLWENTMANAFLIGYREALIAHPDLLPQPEHAQALLLTFLFEKALYELLYELNNRPEWLPLPLNGLMMLSNQNSLTATN
jgi:maltose alpha-D-glucosyltransferase/alpha-amylase